MNTRGLMELIVAEPRARSGRHLAHAVHDDGADGAGHHLHDHAAPALDLPAGGARQGLARRAGAARRVPAAADVFTVLMCVSYERSGPGMVTLASALAGQRTRGEAPLRPAPHPADRSRPRSTSTRGPSGEGGRARAAPVAGRRSCGAEVRPLSLRLAQAEPRHLQRRRREAGRPRAASGGTSRLLSQTVLGGTVYEVMRGAQADVGVLIDRGLAAVRKRARAVPRHVARQGGARAGRAGSRSRSAPTSPSSTWSSRSAGPATRSARRRRSTSAFEGEEGRRAGESKVVLKVVEHDSAADAALEEAEARLRSRPRRRRATSGASRSAGSASAPSTSSRGARPRCSSCAATSRATARARPRLPPADPLDRPRGRARSLLIPCQRCPMLDGAARAARGRDEIRGRASAPPRRGGLSSLRALAHASASPAPT